MSDAVLESLLQQVSEFAGDELDTARADYFYRCGEPFEDESDYEGRLQNFIEWYVFDWPLKSGLTPFESFMADVAGTPREAEFLAFRDQIHSLFRVRAVKAGGLSLQDLFTETKYFVPREITAGFEAGTVIEARLIDADATPRLTHTLLIHPRPCTKLIRKAARKIRKAQNIPAWRELMCRSSNLALRASRYKHVDARKIYEELLGEGEAAKKNWFLRAEVK